MFSQLGHLTDDWKGSVCNQIALLGGQNPQTQAMADLTFEHWVSLVTVAPIKKHFDSRPYNNTMIPIQRQILLIDELHEQEKQAQYETDQ